MAEYRLQFSADSSSAENTIKRLRAEIKKVTNAFEQAEIGSADFLETASDLSGLKKELKDATGAVVDLDKAYDNLARSADQMFAVYSRVQKAAEKYHKSTLDLALDSFEQEDALRKKNFQAELDDWDERLAIASAARKKIERQQQAIMEFRAGMGERGAISGVASPIGGLVGIEGSPADIKAKAQAYEDAYAELLKAADVRDRAIAEFRAGMGAKQVVPGISSPIQGGPDIVGSPSYLAPKSLGDLERRLRKLQEEARKIAPNTGEWKALNRQIVATEKGIERIQRRQKPMGFRQRAGAAGGAFLYGGGLGGGVGSALGGIAGGLLSGVPGAFTGAAIGQAVDNLGTAMAGVAKQAAGIQQVQRGLALASVNAQDFAQAQAAVAEISQRVLLPLEQTTRLFTQLRVNTKEYGLSVEETRKIFEGTALAIAATGGSTEDLEGGMRAVVQILSKGGVQAEELRGQLGERFPGAVVKFAQANKMSFEGLQQGLENGEIGIKEFIEFAKKNYDDYAQFSEQLATAPEFAGKRLQIAFEEMQVAIGSVMGNAGAIIQDAVTGFLKEITRFIKENKTELQQMYRDFASIFNLVIEVVKGAAWIIRETLLPVIRLIQDVIRSAKIAAGAAQAIDYKNQIQSIDKQIEAARKTGDVRAAGRIAQLNKQRQELEVKFKGAGGEAAITGPAYSFGGPGANAPLNRTDKDKEDKEKKTNLEAFERLRDQLANAYNKAEIERIKQRYEVEKRLRDDLFDIQEAGANRLQRQNLSFIRALLNAERQRFEAVMDARLKVDEVMGKVAGGGAAGPGLGAGGAYFQGNIGPTSRGPHFDVKRVGGGYFPRNYLDQFVKVNGRPLSSGVTVPGGTFAGHQRRGSHGWDYAFGGQAAATLTGGAQWMEGVPTQDGERRRFKLPSGEVFQFLHGRSQGIGAGAPRKVGANEIRDTMAEANTEIAKQDALLTERNAELLKSSAITKAVAQYVSEAFGVPDLILDNKLLQERNRLTAEGVDENTISYRLRLLEIDEQNSDLQKRLSDAIKELNLSEEDRKRVLGALPGALQMVKQAEKEKNDETLRGILIQKTAEQDRRLALARAISPDDELMLRIGQENPTFTTEQIQQYFQKEKVIQEAQTLKDQLNSIASSISEAFGNAFKGFVTGATSAREALAGIFSSIADSFADMVAQMIAEWIKLQILNIVQSFIPSPGGASSLGPGNISKAFTPSGPTFNPKAFSMPPLIKNANGNVLVGGFQAFANGGIVTGPTLGLVGEGRFNEAVVPLPNGRSIPVELNGSNGGGGDVNVIVNVDAKGTGVQGDSPNANQLGRVISSAVQAEIVKQQRPGGLLSTSARGF